MGHKSTRSREIADRLMAEGVTPLQVLLEAMRDRYAQGDLAAAAGYAKDAAPYMHPRLAAVEMNAAVRTEGRLLIKRVIVHADAGAGPGDNGTPARGAGAVLSE